MISFNNGEIKIEGTRGELLADVGVILRVMIQKGITDVDTLHDIVETANLTDEEVHEQLKGIIATAILGMISDDVKGLNSESSKERTKHAEDMLNIIKEVQRRKK